MRKKKIDDEKLKDMLLIDRKSQREAADHFGVTEAAISQRVKQLNLNLVRNASLERAADIVDHKIDALAQLHKINSTINTELDWLTEQVSEFEGVNQRQVVEDQILKHSQEIRHQLKLQLDIFRVLYDMQAVEQFQEEVLNAIAEASPAVRDRIIENLRARRAIRSVTRLGGATKNGC